MCNNLFFSVFQVWFEVEEEDVEGEKEDAKGGIAFCLQAEHAGTRTYYFSTDSLEDREEWVQAMSEAAKVHISPPTRYTHKCTHAGMQSYAHVYTAVFLNISYKQLNYEEIQF